MTVRVGINGFGRIGRNYFRAAKGTDVDIVAVNDLTDNKTLAHLLKYDSTFGRLGDEVSFDDESITVGGERVLASAQRDPSQLPWGDLGVDVCIESTGIFTKRDDAAQHLKSGARKVIISAPAKDEDVTIVMGVNQDKYDPAGRHHLQRLLHHQLGGPPGQGPARQLRDREGLHDHPRLHQRPGHPRLPAQGPPGPLGGGQHHPHLDRRGQAASWSSPSSRASSSRIALRVPVEDGSLTDLAVVLSRGTTAEEINDAYKQAAEGPLAGIIRYSTDPIVSRDIVGDDASASSTRP